MIKKLEYALQLAIYFVTNEHEFVIYRFTRNRINGRSSTEYKKMGKWLYFELFQSGVDLISNVQ